MGRKVIDRDKLVTRFAPSPTGYLHLGHAYSVFVAQSVVRQSGGTLLVRMEDIDSSRCRSEYEQAILDDLEWLGIIWEKPIRRQSDHIAEYRKCLRKLSNLGVIYPCFCSRKEIKLEVERMNQAPHINDGTEISFIYPGTCRSLKADQVHNNICSGMPYALRLDAK